ncbi:hypothetical protein QFZ31_006697 [Neobacillus niacini]|uniref:hypothetical protein n=1 Tax=Neobacillus driksii TaxID=3035913 RepID=UPI0027890A66|nr:hypothetical protein [Neobacillus niacini]MDQ0976645.1 hypothetical protein [Neobacillus niacini]
MTKKEMALTLAKQYIEIESNMYDMNEQRDLEKEKYGRDSSEYDWSKNQVRKLRSNMQTILDSKTLLGISNKIWSDATWTAYVERSEKEKALA